MGSQRRDERSVWAIAVDAATIVIALCALTVTAFVVRSRSTEAVPAVSSANRLLSKADRSKAEAHGHLLGSADAPVRIVEFGDYQCPFCRQEEKVLKALRAAYPDDVALLFRQYPLSYHAHAYFAARLAECAAAQGRFTRAHDLLFDVDLSELKPGGLARAAQVPDTARFLACGSSEDSVAAIGVDVEAADELGVDGVPTVIVQGTMLTIPPDSAELFALVDKILRSSPNR